MLFNLHLISRKVNTSHALSRQIKKHQIQPQEVCLDFFIYVIFHFWEFAQFDGACSMTPKQTTQTFALSSTTSAAIYVNLVRQGHRSGRSARPRRPVAQSRPPTAPKKKQGRRKPSFSSPSLPPKPHQHQPGDDFAQKFDRRIPVAAAREGFWGGASNNLLGDLLAGAGKTSLPLAAALRGGRAPSLASLVANRCFLTLCVIRI